MSSLRLDVITIFPEYLDPLRHALLGKAIEQGILAVGVHDLRDWAQRQPDFVEAPFEITIGSAVVRGRMDAVFRLADGSISPIVTGLVEDALVVGSAVAILAAMRPDPDG